MEKILKLALETKRPLIIMYMSKKDILRRKVRILRIDENRVYAYCYLREQNRYFTIDGILSAQLAE